MRKILFAIIGMVMFQLSEAQVKFAFGPKVGIGYNTMNDEINGQSIQEFYNTLLSGSDIKARVFNIGFLYGGFAELGLGNKIGLQVEYLFSGEGTGVKITEDGESYNDGASDFTRRFKMTNIPLLAKVYVSENVGVYGGVQLATIREITELTGTASSDNKPETVPESEWSQGIKDSWTAVVVGVSAEQSGLVIDLRATIGPEIGKSPDDYSYTPLSIQLGIAYKLMGKRD